LEFAPTLMSDETLVTPCVSSASAIARPTVAAESALPFNITSPFLASTSKEAFAVWLSACSLPLTMVLMTASSVEPVGAPTTLSLVRTIVTPRSRSDWISVVLRRHSVMRDEMSELVLLELLLLSDELPAPVELLDPAVAPIVLLA